MRRFSNFHGTEYKFGGAVQLGPHRLQLRPREGHTPPMTEWKRLEGIRDVLPAKDQELLDQKGSEPAT